MDYTRIKKTKTKLRYKGISIDTLQNMQWYPKIYKDPFKFDFEKVKQRMLDAKEAGYSDDVSTIKRNILRVTRDNPGSSTNSWNYQRFNMYMNNDIKIHKPELKAFCVIVKNGNYVIADYMFDGLKEAMVFESQMRDKGYTTETIRKEV